VLLAALGHPDRALRDRLRCRLDAAIEAGQPLHSEDRIRDFLTTQPGTPLTPFYLDPLALEVGVRVTRLLFSRQTRKHARRTLRLTSCEGLDDECGLVLNHHLKSLYLERFVYSRKKRSSPRRRRHGAERPEYHGLLVHRACRRFDRLLQHSTVLVSGGATPRLQQFGTYRRIDAECRAEDGFCLTLRGDLPWAAADLLTEAGLNPRSLGPKVRLADGSTLGAHRGLAALGLALEAQPGELRLRTTIPESVLRFSACLARGERLVLRDAIGRAPGRVVVLLRDFDGASARLPAAVSYAGAETWLRGLPPFSLPVDDDERLAIARWAYPPEVWLTNETLEKLL
jgi:hypothetical protein